MSLQAVEGQRVASVFGDRILLLAIGISAFA